MSRFSAFLFAAFLAGCAQTAGPKHPQKPTQVLVASPGPEVVSVPTRVAAPSDLVGLVRVKNPALLLDTLTDWARLPLAWRTLAASRFPGLTEVAALDAPLDALALLAPPSGKALDQPLAALSLGLKSLARAVQHARDQGQDVERIPPDLYQLGGIFGHPCAMGPALGAAPARLVCGDDDQGLQALLPYASRGLPLEQLSNSDIHLELRAEPLRRRYGEQLERLSALAPLAMSQLSQDNPIFDRALGDAVHGLTDEALAIVQDLDKLRIDATASSQRSTLEVEFGIRFRSKSSWLAQVADDAVANQAKAPALFWRLPKDASIASFRYQGSTRGKDAIQAAVSGLAEGFTDHEGLPESLRKDLGNLIKLTFAFEPALMVSASGEPATSSGAEFASPLEAILRNQMKWSVIGFQAPSTPTKEALGLLARLINHASLKALAKKNSLDPKWLPRAKLRPAPNLAPGAEQLELLLPARLLDKADSTIKHKDFSLFVAVVPEGEVTWIFTGPSETVIRDRVKMLLKGSGSLAERTDLELLKTENAFSGGFLQARSVLGSLAPDMSKKVLSALNATKHHGETPAFFFASAAKIGAGVEMHTSLVIPKELIQDGVAAAAAASF